MLLPLELLLLELLEVVTGVVVLDNALLIVPIEITPGPHGTDCPIRPEGLFRRGARLPGHPRRVSGYELPLEQRQHSLRSGIGLRHGSDGSLLQRLGLGEVGGLLRHIGIADLRLGGGEVGDL